MMMKRDAKAVAAVMAEPFWFGDATCPLMGWYHAPHAYARHTPIRSCGVVLCAPFGHEYLVAYRAYRKLAERLAQAGFPVVFFDYDGCGDSADSDGPRVAAWQHGITLAIAALKQRSGVAKVALFGVRLGALLAASVAATTPVAALALVAPVVSGRGYVRELKAFARLSPLPVSPDRAQAVTESEITGYALDATTQADLGQLDMLKLLPTLGCPVFLNGRDDVSGSERKLLETMRQHQADVTVCPLGGYAAMMTSDAHSTQVPDAVWDALVTWMGGQFAIENRADYADNSKENPELDFKAPLTNTWSAFEAIDTDTAPHTQLHAAGAALGETLVSFNGLSGVVTEPHDRPTTAIAVVLTNIGSSHRVGNHRLYVQLARSLAANGFCVLRFDRAGMGYSRATPQGQENEVYAASGIDDVRAAMDFLQVQRASTGFVLGGLCSGAYFSYHAATLDPRAVGLVMINPLTFQWHEGDVLSDRIQQTIKSNGFYLRALTDASTWKRALAGEIALKNIATKLATRLAGRLQQLAQRISHATGLTSQQLPPVARNFKQLQARGTECLFIFGADDAAIDVVAAELGPNASLLGSSAHLTMETVPYADHTFTPRWSQRYLVDYLVGYCKQRFGSEFSGS